MSVRITDAADNDLMTVEEIGRDGNKLVIRGTIYGAMPMTARVSPKEARNALRLLRPSILLFLLTLPFRKN